MILSLVLAAALNVSVPTDATVLYVHDGDTVRVRYADGVQETVRMLGADTPELHHPTKPVQPCAHEAWAAMRALVEGRTIKLETDRDAHDRYGRRLAHIRLPETDTLVAERLVWLGLARVLIIKPNSANIRTALVAAQADAQKAKRGVWATAKSKGCALPVAAPEVTK